MMPELANMVMYLLGRGRSGAIKEDRLLQAVSVKTGASAEKVKECVDDLKDRGVIEFIPGEKEKMWYIAR